jgi:hypothetical protein
LDVDFTRLITYDSTCFAPPNSPYRQAFLEKWISIPGSEALVALDEGKLVGFGCRRPALPGQNHLIGPLYADNLEIALALVRDLVKHLDPNKDAIWLNIW